MKPEIKTYRELKMEPINFKIINKKFISLDSLKEYLKERIEEVEIAGYENPIDESYYNALVSVYEEFFGEWEE